MLPTAIAWSAVATNTAKVAWAVHCRIASCAASVSVRTSGSGPSSRIEPARTNGTPCITSACMIPAVTIPCCTAALMPPTRALARHGGLHEAEFVRAVAAAKEAFGMDQDALAAVLRGGHGHELALLDATRLGDDEVRLRVKHDHAVHARQARPAPRGTGVHVGGEIRGRKKSVGQNPVGRRGLEARIRRASERRRVEVRGAVLEAGPSGHWGRKLNEIGRASCRERG